MSEDAIELSEENAARWYETFEGTEALSRLLATAEDVKLSIDALERERVIEHEDEIGVYLYHEESKGNYVRITGYFNLDSEELQKAELDDAYVSAPLAGHGMIWRYEDGEITSNRWIS